MLICTVCGCAYQPGGRWQTDWCPACTELNFASSIDVRLDDELAPARAALEAYVSSAHPLSPRQVAAMARLAQRWAQESRT